MTRLYFLPSLFTNCHSTMEYTLSAFIRGHWATTSRSVGASISCLISMSSVDLSSRTLNNFIDDCRTRSPSGGPRRSFASIVDTSTRRSFFMNSTLVGLAPTMSFRGTTFVSCRARGSISGVGHLTSASSCEKRRRSPATANKNPPRFLPKTFWSGRNGSWNIADTGDWLYSG